MATTRVVIAIYTCLFCLFTCCLSLPVDPPKEPAPPGPGDPLRSTCSVQIHPDCVNVAVITQFQSELCGLIQNYTLMYCLKTGMPFRPTENTKSIEQICEENEKKLILNSNFEIYENNLIARNVFSNKLMCHQQCSILKSLCISLDVLGTAIHNINADGPAAASSKPEIVVTSSKSVSVKPGETNSNDGSTLTSSTKANIANVPEAKPLEPATNTKPESAVILVDGIKHAGLPEKKNDSTITLTNLGASKKNDLPPAISDIGKIADANPPLIPNPPILNTGVNSAIPQDGNTENKDAPTLSNAAVETKKTDFINNGGGVPDPNNVISNTPGAPVMNSAVSKGDAPTLFNTVVETKKPDTGVGIVGGVAEAKNPGLSNPLFGHGVNSAVPKDASAENKDAPTLSNTGVEAKKPDLNTGAAVGGEVPDANTRGLSNPQFVPRVNADLPKADNTENKDAPTGKMNPVVEPKNPIINPALGVGGGPIDNPNNRVGPNPPSVPIIHSAVPKGDSFANKNPFLNAGDVPKKTDIIPSTNAGAVVPETKTHGAYNPGFGQGMNSVVPKDGNAGNKNPPILSNPGYEPKQPIINPVIAVGGGGADADNRGLSNPAYGQGNGDTPRIKDVPTGSLSNPRFDTKQPNINQGIDVNGRQGYPTQQISDQFNRQRINNEIPNINSYKNTNVPWNRHGTFDSDPQHQDIPNYGQQETFGGGVQRTRNPKQEKTLLHAEYNETPSSAHFMGYFLTAIVLCIAGYVVFHNKGKIVAFIIEGRNQKRSRRPNSGEYKKLQTNVDDVMSSLEKTTTSKNYIY